VKERRRPRAARRGLVGFVTLERRAFATLAHGRQEARASSTLSHQGPSCARSNAGGSAENALAPHRRREACARAAGPSKQKPVGGNQRGGDLPRPRPPLTQTPAGATHVPSRQIFGRCAQLLRATCQFPQPSRTRTVLHRPAQAVEFRPEAFAYFRRPRLPPVIWPPPPPSTRPR
jgi:hypothetical protein